MLALGVTNPAASGLGGGGFALYYEAKTKQLTFIDFRERAGSAATADMFQQATARGVVDPSRLGGLAAGVPGEPAGIEALLHKFGKLSRDRVTEPAALLAEQGAAVSTYLADILRDHETELLKDPVAQSWLMDHGHALAAGAIAKNPALARAIRALGQSGAQSFYLGPIARQIVQAVQKHKGHLSREDLAAYRVVERAPLCREHFGRRICSAPPPSAGGYTLLASLALLEHWLSPSTRANEPELIHALAESFKGPFMDRQHYFGDPDYAALPIDALLAPERIQQRAALYHRTLALDPNAYALPLPEPVQETVQPEGGGTSHLCVVDAEGNVAAVTTTVNLPFGARFTAHGILLNDQMDDFARGVGERNAFGLVGGAHNLAGPGHRPVSTMSPTIVFDRDGNPELCIGGSGGSRIVTAVAQATYRVLVLGQAPGDVMALPRMHHQADPDRLEIEASADPHVVAQLSARGHTVKDQAWTAKVQMIQMRHDSPHLRAASDPRKGGAPAGQ
jgi:gamma-glutamyltranspeptidase/glutathione hydrolase